MIIGWTYLLIRKIEFRKQLYNILKIKRSFLSRVREYNTRLNSPLIVITNSEKNKQANLKTLLLEGSSKSENCQKLEEIQ